MLHCINLWGLFFTEESHQVSNWISYLDVSNIKFLSKKTFYKDNQGDIQVATRLIITLTSKYSSVKYHLFLEHVKNTLILIKKNLKIRRDICSLKDFK